MMKPPFSHLLPTWLQIQMFGSERRNQLWWFKVTTVSENILDSAGSVQ